MQHFLVPHDVSASTATLWMAALGAAPGAANMEIVSDTPVHAGHAAWETWPPDGGPARLRYRRVTVTGLEPDRRHVFTLLADGRPVAHARLTTLPEQLPPTGGKPFTVLLGSCFSVIEDGGGRVGNTYFHLPHDARPDVKILAGDQVYLDSPWYCFATRTHGVEELRSIFLAQYTRSWGQEPGFHQLLTDGANYFCSDDHEFWNNAPNPGAYVLDTWPILGDRQGWWKTAQQLYNVFQAPGPTAGFSVYPISFFIADTRVARAADRSRLMPDSELGAVADWVRGLQGPGFLVLGQPILNTTTTLLKGHFGD
ncbi:MAG TPA: hypothetical protein VK943_02530, partial [Arenibaculum sp.]|nr:hypothetical protein [Arenibaculum sp.]